MSILAHISRIQELPTIPESITAVQRLIDAEEILLSSSSNDTLQPS